MKRLHISRKIYLPFLGLVLVLTAWLIYSRVWHKSVEPAGLDLKYVSLSGGYLFSVPAKYIANGVTMSGVTLVYPEASPPEDGQSLNDLYLQGTVAVQPIGELKDDNPEAFMTYIKDVLVADLGKIFKGATDLRPATQKDAVTAEVYALGEAGKRLRANYAIDFTQPVLVAAGDRSDAFLTVGFTMEDLKKTSLKSDIDQAAEATKDIAQKLQQQNSVDLRKNATAGFKKKMTEEKLVDTLNKSAQYLKRPINIVGGLYDGKFFVAQLVFEAKTAAEQPISGIVSLQKVDNTWKLDGFQLSEL